MEWRQIPDFETYEISDDGQIRDVCSKDPVRTSYHPSKSGGWGPFVAVRLTGSNGKKQSLRVHRLVALAFKPPDFSRMSREDLEKKLAETLWVRHLDDNNQNNQVDNLEWGTPKQNSEDMKRNKIAREFGVSPQEVTDFDMNPLQNVLF